MSYFDQANTDIPFRLPSVGDKADFITASGLSYDALARAGSEYGVGMEMTLQMEKEYDKIRATGAAPAYQGRERGASSALAYAQFLEGANEDPAVKAEIDRWDRAAAAAKTQDPSIRSMSEIWSGVKQQAVDAEHKWEATQTSIGGMIGGFAGGFVAGTDPFINPFGAATFNIGGIGKTAVTRIAAEAGTQGALAGLQELAGVASDRQALGLESHSLPEIVAMGAIGGGILAGAGEGLAHLRARYATQELPRQIVKDQPIVAPASTVAPPPFQPQPIGDGLHLRLDSELPLPRGMTEWELKQHSASFEQVRNVLDDPSAGLHQLSTTFVSSDPGLFQPVHHLMQSDAMVKQSIFRADPELAMHLSQVTQTIASLEQRLKFGDAIATNTVEQLKVQLEKAAQEQITLARRAVDPQVHARMDDLEATIAKVKQRVDMSGFAGTTQTKQAADELARLITEREALRPVAERAAAMGEQRYPVGQKLEPPQRYSSAEAVQSYNTPESRAYSGKTIFSDALGDTKPTVSIAPKSAEEAAAFSKAAATQVETDLQKMIDLARQRLQQMAENAAKPADAAKPIEKLSQPELERALKGVTDDQEMLNAMMSCARA